MYKRIIEKSAKKIVSMMNKMKIFYDRIFDYKDDFKKIEQDHI